LAHGVMIVTPVYWYMASSPLKLMIDRLVCADGGNPDPTSTSGKDPEKAKDIELGGWNYPQHLAGRAYSVVVHGDVAGTEAVRRGLSDWLDGMGFVDAGAYAKLDRYIGYFEPYATSHETLDREGALFEEVKNASTVLLRTVAQIRSDAIEPKERGLKRPRSK
jgi:multimeric flavodoxin WrbA